MRVLGCCDFNQVPLRPLLITSSTIIKILYQLSQITYPHMNRKRLYCKAARSISTSEISHLKHYQLNSHMTVAHRSEVTCKIR